MKKTVSPFRLFAATFIAVAVSHFTPSLVAQIAPPHGRLPNVDKRAVGIAQLPAAKQEALAGLRNRVPGLQADVDPLLKSPTFFSSTKGFLTGPNGAGKSVSAEVANAFPENDPHRSIKAFLKENAKAIGHGLEVLSGAKINREFSSKHNGLKTTVWQQQVDGIPVFKALLIGHVTKNGELVNLSTHFLADAAKAADAGTPNRLAAQNAPTISATEAIVRAAQDIGNEVTSAQIKATSAAKGDNKQQRFNAAPVLNGETVAELTWLPMSDSSLRLAWQVLFTSRARGEMFMSVVDAQTGEVLVRHGLTEYISDASYNVYTSDSPSPFSPGHSVPSSTQPPVVSRVLVVTNAVSVIASPNGWINDGDTETVGNNVDAHLDRNDDNTADLPRPNGGTTRVFDFPLNLAQGPANYGDASVVNLFYWNNWYHDKVYALGFTEAAGNFQTDNFGRGGLGGDPLLADAQDGLSLPDPFHDNNANMQTPPDGFSPRMQMYKFSGPNPDRDGDLDAEVMLHEHTHGLSNRRVGGGAGLFNLQSRGMGEGWSDFYALTLLSEPGDDVNGAYASGGYVTFDFFGLTENYYFGIRRYPYSTDMTKEPLTYKDIDPNQASSHAGIPVSPLFGGSPADEVHAQGEVWCAVLWETRAAMINKYGYAIGNQLILQLVTDGMNLSPANPTFLQARDGILLADQVNNAGANQNELWAAFAKRGMGALAGSPASTTTAGVIESYDVPGLAYSSSVISGGNANGIIDFNECNSLQITLTNIGIGASNITVTMTTTTPEVIVAQAFSLYPNIPSGGSGVNFTSFKISTSPTFVCGTPVELALIIKSDVDTRTNLFRLPSGVVGTPVRFDNNTVVSIPDANPVGATSPMVVSNFNGTIGKVTVGLYITHSFTFDLQLQLIAPDGTTVTLSQNNGGQGDNFGSSCSPDNFRTRFDDAATVAISAGNPPFVGAFQPDQPLSNFNLKSGTNVNGIWQLKVVDQLAIDTGAIQCWSLFLSPQTCTDGGGECPGSDLAATMIANPDPAITSSNLTYTITVTNHGPSAAKAVVLSQALPAGTIFVSANSSQGNCQQSGGTVTCNLGKISARGGARITVVVRPTTSGTISSTATVGSSQSDPDPSNNSFTLVTRVVPPSADLAVTILDSPDPVSAGGNLTYTISVTNRGPTAANSVVLSNTLPSTVIFASASSTQGSFVNTGGTIVFNLGSLANGGGAVATIVVRPTENGSITATAQVSSGQVDLIPANNTASATTTVTPAADLALSVVDNPDPAVVGSNVTYVISLTNVGPNTATGVSINGTLPSNATLVSSNLSQGSLVLSGNTFLANIGTLNGGPVTLTFVVTAPLTPQTLTLTATASASQTDSNPANNSVTATTSVAEPNTSVIPAGSTLITESISPANGAVDSGETVTVELRLQNVGNISTTNLNATLLSGTGVTPLSGVQNYGVLANGGAAVGRNFSFTASGSSGQTITATLQLQDGSGPVTNVTFNFALPKVNTFSNTNLITIPDHGIADPYPSQIAVSGVTGLVDKVTVTLNKLAHTYPDDVDILLVDPTGRKVLLMSDAGGPNPLTNVVLTFDSAAFALADEDQLVSGSFAPADYAPADSFTNAPAGPYETSLENLDGTSPNGTWSLYVVDDNVSDLGSIRGGWSLAITTITPVNKVADVVLSVVNAPVTAQLNQNISYTFLVVNNGPDVASNVMFNNPLPPNSTAVSALATSLGNLAPGSNVIVTVTLNASATGLLTNRASVSANEIDLNSLNNSAKSVTSVVLPVADVSVVLSGATTAITGSNYVYTLTAANNGPDSALNVVVTNRLPANVAYVSSGISPSVSNNVLTFALGGIGAGNSLSFPVTVTPLAAGIMTNNANVITRSSDSNSANNIANLTVTVANPAPRIEARGATLLAENLSNNGGLDIGEMVTVTLRLTNSGTADTANLVATLQPANGVTAPSAPQNYGAVVRSGAVVGRNFTFTANGVMGGVVTAQLQLQDGANNLGVVNFTFELPKLGAFTNSATISIPNSGPATPYPSTITVAGVTGLVDKVVATLNGITHSFPDDLDILLVSPDGHKVLLMSDVGGSHSISGLNLVFNDAGALLSNSNQLFSGTFRPSDFEIGDLLSAPAPVGPYAPSLSAFNGGNPNGDWSLYISDDAAGDLGNVSGGWSLALTTVVPINPPGTVLGSLRVLFNGNFQMTLNSEAGAQHRIEVSSNLTSWTSISTNTAGSDGTYIFTDTATSSFNPRFYRAVRLP